MASSPPQIHWASACFSAVAQSRSHPRQIHRIIMRSTAPKSMSSPKRFPSLPHAGRGQLLDLRAPRRLQLSQFMSWRWQRVAVLILGDVLALATAWQVARYLNQFYSPVPPRLVWWVWFGLPSLFWILAAATQNKLQPP